MTPDTEKEIAHFNQLDNQWWNPKGHLRTLHHINPVRLQFIQQHLNLNHQQGLDVGCGGGILTESLAQAGAQMTGIDLSEEAIQVAQTHAQQHKLIINYEIKDLATLVQEKPQDFDFVTALEIIEHLSNPQVFVHQLSQVVKPGGWIFISTLNRTLKSKILAIGLAEYVLNLVPQGTHQWTKFIQPHELNAWAEESGLSLITLKGIVYNPLTQKAKLAEDVRINYIMAFKKEV